MTSDPRETIRQAVEWLRARPEVQAVLQRETTTDNEGEVSVSPRAFAAFDSETECRHPWTVLASARGDMCEVYLPRAAIEALGSAGVINYNQASQRYRLTPNGWAAILDTNKLGEMLSSFVGEPHLVAGLLTTYTETEEAEQTEPPLRIIES